MDKTSCRSTHLLIRYKTLLSCKPSLLIEKSGDLDSAGRNLSASLWKMEKNRMEAHLMFTLLQEISSIYIPESRLGCKDFFWAKGYTESFWWQYFWFCHAVLGAMLHRCRAQVSNPRLTRDVLRHFSPWQSRGGRGLCRMHPACGPLVWHPWCRENDPQWLLS